MAFVAGSANTVNEVLSALQNACTANGWALSSGILSKGDCYAKPFINDGTIALIAGTGQSGTTVTNTPVVVANSAYVPGYPNLWTSLSGIDNAIAYPLTYSIHIMENPNEVYLFINHSVDNWSYIAFGQSPIADLPGTGIWYGGTGIGKNIVPSSNISNTGANGHLSCALFSYVAQGGTSGNSMQTIKCFFHHSINDLPSEWSGAGVNGVGTPDTISWAGMPSQANATLTLMPLMTREPSVWNSGAALHPIQPSIIRPDNRRSVVGNLSNARYARIDNIDPGQIVTIGNEKWRFYPWLKKNIADRNATGADKSHSGTYAIAIRYDGN